jgi:hypothetical protein
MQQLIAAHAHSMIAVLGRGRVPSLNGFKDAIATTVKYDRNLGVAHEDPLVGIFLSFQY